MKTEGYETVVPCMKQPKLMARTKIIWVMMRASTGSEERLKSDAMLYCNYFSIAQCDTSGCDEHPIDLKTKVLFWPGQARTGQAKTELLF